ncbi:2-isopropylmalate synthase [Lusitaniella coriacea LEGE 07157]|uniref:2-isopropylmalate synthase n=1 Tax=Lusitaniella coriacea LEGE 07157 TaxID=945747 RepID=A0A8J7B7M0_9CYAN|nr:2-isopropylmalate synthase [Lusitaniella coriacea]MBE9114460.1 2-isopropylmalate synthase [Lusitaniella coriacea LEGE 07157]
MSEKSPTKINIFDTTLRDGELTPEVTMNLQQKIEIAQLQEAIGVDIIEVGYPGAFPKDFDEVLALAKIIKNSTVCGLASSKSSEIERVAEAIKPANRGRIHLYSTVNLKDRSQTLKNHALNLIKNSITLARNYCDDVEWSAFDAARSDRGFLCKSVELAISSGATTVSIPDSFGSLTPEEFSELIATVVNQVPNIDRAILSVHCHNDRGFAVENSLAALPHGVRQIECSVNGLGARKGNADLSQIVIALSPSPDYFTDINPESCNNVSQLVTQITGIEPP